MEECNGFGNFARSRYAPHTHPVASFHSGFYGEGSFIRLMLYTVLALFMSSFETPCGICDCLLWTHACAGITGFISPMALPLGIRRLLSIGCGLRGDIYIRAPVLLFIVLTTSLVTDIGLSFHGSKWWTIIMSSVFMVTHIGVAYFLQQPEKLHTGSVVSEASVGTELIIPEVITCTLVQTEPTVIECIVEAVETPAPKQEAQEDLGSPGEGGAAASTPSEMGSQLNWLFDSNEGADGASSGPPTPAHSAPSEWFYIDLSGDQQGPFPADLMRTWYASGFLTDDLLVSSDPQSGYVPIGTITPSPFE